MAAKSDKTYNLQQSINEQKGTEYCQDVGPNVYVSSNSSLRGQSRSSVSLLYINVKLEQAIIQKKGAQSRQDVGPNVCVPAKSSLGAQSRSSVPMVYINVKL